jgi:hypothetical protein
LILSEGSKTGVILSDNEKTKDTLHWVVEGSLLSVSLAEIASVTSSPVEIAINQLILQS